LKPLSARCVRLPHQSPRSVGRVINDSQKEGVAGISPQPSAQETSEEHCAETGK